MSARSYSSDDEEELAMAEPNASPIRPTGEPAGEHVPTAPATPPFLTQLVEDVRLAERVVRALRANGDGRLCGVGVTIYGRILVLEGRVGSHNLKQVAEETALAVPEIDQVHNRLEVV
jgi:hypothetical protein